MLDSQRAVFSAVESEICFIPLILSGLNCPQCNLTADSLVKDLSVVVARDSSRDEEWATKVW